MSRFNPFPVGLTGLFEVMADVADFHEAVGQPVLDKPTVPEDDRVQLRWKLIEEEYTELFEGMFDDCGNVEVNLVETADALGDLIYVLVGTALEMGIPLDKVWNEIQRSNMSKMGPDGKAIVRPDGKILKGPGFSPPDIEGCLK